MRPQVISHASTFGLALAMVALQFVASPGVLSAQDKVGTTAAPFLTISSGARASAMGGAYASLSDDASGAFWNPAGLVALDRSTVMFSNLEWFESTRIQDATMLFKGGEKSVLAVQLRSFDYGEFEVTTIESPEGTGEIFDPSDLSVGLTWAGYITDKFSAGATAKFVQQKIWNEAATGMAVDLGMIYRTGYRNLQIGMFISNFGTDMQMSGDDLRQAIDIDPSKSGNNDRLEGYLGTDEWPMPLTFRVGVSMDALNTTDHRILVAVDAKHPSDNSESLDVGMEYGFRDLLYLRGGYRSLFSSRTEDQGLTLGLGLRLDFDGVGFDVGAAYLTNDYFSDPIMITMQIGF